MGKHPGAAAGAAVIPIPWQPSLLLARGPVVSHRVTVTAYSSTPDQTDATPTLGACGQVGPGTVALSRDLFRLYGCGSRVRVKGVEYTVRDTMHPRWRLRADVWMPSRGAAMRWGLQQVILEPVQ